MFERLDRIFGRVKETGIRPKGHLSAGVFLTYLADHGQGLNRIAVGKGHGVDLGVFFDFNLDPSRQGVNNTDTHPVQTAREFVIFARELTTRMQTGQDQLNPRHPMFWVDIDWHAPAVVGHANAPVGQQGDFDAIAVSAHGLVNRVIDHLLDQVIGTLRVGVHTGAASNRF